jgi:PhoH-like ATPase
VIKHYVLDTNVLLHNPQAIHSFAENHVVIPFAVIEEIDNRKKGQDEIGRHARMVSRELDSLRVGGHLATGVSLAGGGRLRIEMNHQEQEKFPQGLDPSKHDNRILAVCFGLSLERKEPVILVTKDLNLRIKADVLGIRSEDFQTDKVDYSNLYTGACDLYASYDSVEAFFRDGEIPWPDDEVRPDPNGFVVLKDRTNPSRSGLGRYLDGRLKPLLYANTKNWGIRARNKEQKFSLELLLDDRVKVVTLVGPAGTGKTLLALAVGLEMVLEQRAYDRLLVTRPIIPMGNDLGYLPGSKEEKLRVWMQPIFDNLEFLFRKCPDPPGILDDFFRNGLLEMEALTYIRGRTIPGQYILCDEAQNLSPNMIKTLVTRVGEGSKIVLTGDPEQIDHPYLDASSNGLTYLVERIREEEIAGHVSLFKGERSQVAEIGARRL